MTARCYCNHDMVETNRHYEIVEGRPELQVELTCTNPECGNVRIRRFPIEQLQTQQVVLQNVDEGVFRFAHPLFVCNTTRMLNSELLLSGKTQNSINYLPGAQ